MNMVSEILKDISHRPYQLPHGRWQFYQEWNEVLFLHWTVPVESIRKLVPEELDIDLFDGKAYISLVPFSMKNVRPRYLPAFPLISDFHEINIRTYVSKHGRQGVYFLRIEAEKTLSTFLSRKLSGLPYKKSTIKRQNGTYSSIDLPGESKFYVEFKTGGIIASKTDLDKWLTERYCLFYEKGNKLFRYGIHHKEWPLRSVEIKNLEISIHGKENDFMKESPEISHYSDGLKVLSWRRYPIFNLT